MRWMLVTVGLVASGAAAVWWRSHPAEPPADAAQRYEDIPRPEYEQWMQDLGYTE
jgi:hypothetical protein